MLLFPCYCLEEPPSCCCLPAVEPCPQSGAPPDRSYLLLTSAFTSLTFSKQSLTSSTAHRLQTSCRPGIYLLPIDTSPVAPRQLEHGTLTYRSHSPTSLPQSSRSLPVSFTDLTSPLVRTRQLHSSYHRGPFRGLACCINITNPGQSACRPHTHKINSIYATYSAPKVPVTNSIWNISATLPTCLQNWSPSSVSNARMKTAMSRSTRRKR